MLGPVGTLREQRRPNGTSNRDVRGIHDPYRSGLVVVLRVQLDGVSFLVVRHVGHCAKKVSNVTECGEGKAYRCRL